MRVINMNVKPKISLKRSPPHNERRNIFSDFFRLIKIRENPMKKFIKEINAPSIMDLKTTVEIKEVK
jgi:hypothetical protein